MVKIQPDPALRTCMAKIPKRAIKTNNDVAKVITEFKERGDDCASKLAATWRSIDDANARIETFNKAQQEAHPQ